MERKKHQERPKKDNLVRHLANLAILHGFFYHSTYYHRGVGQPHATKLGRHGRIYQYHKK